LIETGEYAIQTVLDITVTKIESLQKRKRLETRIELYGYRLIDGDVDAVRKTEHAQIRKPVDDVEQRGNLELIV
jgi:hypothetical protein